MAHELRRVPPDWQHPRNEQGEYVPMLAHFTYNAEEIAEGLRDGWLTDDPPNYGVPVMPQWSEDEVTHFQVYEAVTEGTPVSPVLPTMEAVLDWYQTQGWPRTLYLPPPPKLA